MLVHPAGNYNGISHDSPGQGGEPPENRREARERCPPVAMAGKTRFFENHWGKTWENSGENSENGKDHRKIRDCWVKYPLETTLNLHTDTVNPCSFFFFRRKNMEKLGSFRPVRPSGGRCTGHRLHASSQCLPTQAELPDLGPGGIIAGWWFGTAVRARIPARGTAARAKHRAVLFYLCSHGLISYGVWCCG